MSAPASPFCGVVSLGRISFSFGGSCLPSGLPLAAFFGAPDIWNSSHQDPLGGLEIRPGLSYGITETSCGVQEFTELEFHGDELVVTEVGDRTAVHVRDTRYNLQHGNSWTLQSEQACTDGATSRIDWALWR